MLSINVILTTIRYVIHNLIQISKGVIDLSEGEPKKQKPKKEYEIILDAFRPHLSIRLYGSKLEIIDAHNPKHFRIIDIPEELLHSVQEFLKGSMPSKEFDRLLPKILTAAGEVWEEGYDISARKLILAASMKAHEGKLEEARNKMWAEKETDKREKEG